MKKILKFSGNVSRQIIMASKITDLKYPFNIKNIKPFEATTRSTFSCKKQITYDVSLFSAVKFECNKFITELFKAQPKLKEYQYDIFVKYAVSKLPEGVTEVSQLRFIPNINNYKKFIYVNVELHHPQQAEEDEDEEDEEDEESLPLPQKQEQPQQTRKRKVAFL